MTHHDPPVVRAACTLFAALLRILPGGFRRGYADDVEIGFLDEVREADCEGGSPAVLRATVSGCWDVLRSALDIRWRLTQPGKQWQMAREAGMKTLWLDIRHGWRSLTREPGFAAVALLTLTAGIGANTAIFTLLDAALLRPLPYPDPGRLVRIWGEHRPSGTVRANVNPLDALDWRREAAGIESLGVWTSTTQPLTGAGDPIAIPVAFVTSEFFRALAVVPAAGRLFSADHDQPGRENEVVVTDRFWRGTLGGDPAVVGRTIRLLDVACTVVGVLPPDFASPGTNSANEPLVWRPLVIAPDSSRGGHFARVIARLAPGVSFEQAQAQIDGVQDRLERQFPETNSGQRGRVEPLQRAIAGETSSVLVVLTVTVGLVLLISCANVANLLLARGAMRQREIAIRGALGASRTRVVRQLLTENLLLALLAATFGSLLAAAAVQGIPRWIADELPTVIAPRPDLRVLAFTIALSCTTVLLFGLVPAVLASGRDVRTSLVDGTPGAGGRLRRVQSILLVAEAALAVLLLVGATLLAESLIKLQRVDPGFATDQVLTFRVGLPRTRYPSGISGATFFAAAVDRLSALPGVTAAGGVNMAPLTRRWSCDSFGLADRVPPAQGTEPCAENRVVTPRYFQAMGIPLLQGRFLDDSDTRESQRVVVISESMARQYWPDGNALGQRFKWGSARSNQPWLTIVGVVGSVRTYDLVEPAAPDVYVPLQQSGTTAMTVAVRAARDPATLTGEIRAAIADLDPALAISETFSTAELVARATALPLFRTQVLTTLAVVALGLAVIGVYGVLSFFVAQRRREIGIRLALGATPRGITRFVLRTGLTATAIGSLLGVLASLPLMKLLRDQLFEVSPSDPIALILAPALLLITALIACYVPARRATRLEPAATMRPE